MVAGLDWLLSVVGLSAPDSNDHLIKRVIGLPGDTVACCNAFGQMTVNGMSLDEPYLKLPEGVTKVSADDFKVTVPPKSLWMMGDNRYDSKDSRYNTNQPGKGFVPVDNVVGRAFFVTWPADALELARQLPDRLRGRGGRGEKVSVADPSLDHEAVLHRAGVRYVIGCDEVGRGAIAGPVAVGTLCRERHGRVLPAGLAGLENAQREAP